MAPTTDKEEETLSDGFEVVEKPAMDPNEPADDEPAAGEGSLTAANLERHDRAAEAPSDEEGSKEKPTEEAPFDEKGGEEGAGLSIQTEAAKEEATGGKEIPPSQAGAGLLFGLSGLALGGPLLAVIGGIGGAVAADPANDSKVGEAARAAGDATMEAGEKVGTAAKEANEEYGVLEKIRSLFNTGCARVREFDDEHQVSEKARETVSTVGAKIKEFDTEHRVTERTRETMSDVGTGVAEFEKKHGFGEKFLGGIKSGVTFLMEKIREATQGEGCASGAAAASGGEKGGAEKEGADAKVEGSG